jgi:hypothetical protein
MRRAARISEAIVDGIVARVEPGLPKNDLVAEIFRDAIRGVPDAWGDYAAIVPLLPSGSDAAAPHLTWDGRPFAADTMTFFEVSGCYRRYHAPLCRTVFLGTPPDHVRRAEAALAEGLEAGLDAARAGNRACDVANALAAPLERAGIDRAARCGYPVGLSYPPDWGERTISLPGRGHDRAGTGDDVSLHARAVDGGLGDGDHRDDPDPRGRPGGGAGQPAAPAHRQGLGGGPHRPLSAGPVTTCPSSGRHPTPTLSTGYKGVFTVLLRNAPIRGHQSIPRDLGSFLPHSGQSPPKAPAPFGARRNRLTVACDQPTADHQGGTAVTSERFYWPMLAGERSDLSITYGFSTRKGNPFPWPEDRWNPIHGLRYMAYQTEPRFNDEARRETTETLGQHSTKGQRTTRCHWDFLNRCIWSTNDSSPPESDDRGAGPGLL